MGTNSANDKPSLNTYFQDSRDSDIFEQISQLNLANCETDVADSPAFPVAANPFPDIKHPEPVICKIFASEDVDHASTKSQDMKFFDMLGDNSKYSALCDTMLTDCQTPSFNSTFSPEPPSDGNY